MITNPVLRKEILMRMRLRQPTPARIGIALAVVFGIAWLYWIVLSWMLQDNHATTGRDAAILVISLQFLVVGLIAPSVTANAITQEREQQTWEMLMFTRLLPREIILGKLIARLIPVVAIIAVGFPLALFGCVLSATRGGDYSNFSFGQFVTSYALMFVSGVFFATFGLFTSWLLKRTIYSLMVTYAFLVGGLCIATALITWGLQMFTSDYRFFERCPLMWLNPVYLIGQALSPIHNDGYQYAVYGLCIYVGLTALMLWRMIAGFKRFAYES